MKYILFISLWLVVLSNVLWAKSYIISYEIYDDSNVTAVFGAKKALFEQYDEITERVDDIYIGDLLESEIETFIIDQAVVSYENSVVRVVVGDGLGTYIHGELVQESCVVKPRGESWILSWFE